MRIGHKYDIIKPIIKGEIKTNRTIYRAVWRHQEVNFKDLNWDAFITDAFNCLLNFSGQGFIETDQEFVLKSEAEKYVKKHPISIKRLQGYFLTNWLELYEVVFNEDDCEAGYDLFGFSDLFAVSELDLMNTPIVSNFDLVSALNKAAKENL